MYFKNPKLQSAAADQIPTKRSTLEFGIQCRLVKETNCSVSQFSLRPLRNLCISFAVKGILESIQKPQRAQSLAQRAQRNTNLVCF